MIGTRPTGGEKWCRGQKFIIRQQRAAQSEDQRCFHKRQVQYMQESVPPDGVRGKFEKLFSGKGAFTRLQTNGLVLPVRVITSEITWSGPRSRYSGGLNLRSSCLARSNSACACSRLPFFLKASPSW